MAEADPPRAENGSSLDCCHRGINACKSYYNVKEQNEPDGCPVGRLKACRRMFLERSAPSASVAYGTGGFRSREEQDMVTS